MKKKNQRGFTSVGEQISRVNGLTPLLQTLSQVEEVNQALARELPELAQLCHCGAVDYASDLLVIYANSNAAFYRVNQAANHIQEMLAQAGQHFSKLLVKVRPQALKQKAPRRAPLTAGQQEMLVKFAAAIGRPELVEEPPEAAAEPTDDDWLIKL